MSINTTCPGCKSLFRLGGEMAGKSVRCQKCGKTFSVPLLPVGAEEPTLAEAPGSAPIPGETTILQPPAEKPIEATLLEPPPKVEVVQAKLVEPVRKASRKPAPPPSPGILATLLAVACFLVTMAGVVGFAALWVSNHLSAPAAAILPTKVIANRDFEEVFFDVRKEIDVKNKLPWPDKAKDWMKDKGKENVAVPPPPVVSALPLSNGRASLSTNLINGKKSYLVFLVQKQRYNFLVQSNDFAPRLEITEPIGIRSTKEGPRRVLFSYAAAQTGNHTFTVTPQFGGGNGGFTLEFAPVVYENPPTPINLAQVPKFTVKHALRLNDPVAPDMPASYGPYRTYTLAVKEGTEYRFKITQSAHVPVLILREDGILVEEAVGNPVTRKLDITYQATFTGDLTLLVTGTGNALGNYTLGVTAQERPRP